jgi:hypothetical protein
MATSFCRVLILGVLLTIAAAGPVAACSCGGPYLYNEQWRNEAERARQVAERRELLLNDARSALSAYPDIVIIVGTIYRIELMEDRGSNRHLGSKYFIRSREVWHGNVQREFVVRENSAITCTFEPGVGFQEPLVLCQVEGKGLALVDVCTHVLFGALYREGLIGAATGRSEPLARFPD